jgi:DNA-binding transcriptional regulator YiaG
MPNLSAVLKSEITRLARKEIKGACDPLRKANAGYRREIAELKRQVAALQKRLGAASGVARRAEASEDTPKTATRFVPKGVKSLRARLGLSASEFGRLVGASGQSIYNWEAGKAVPRGPQQAALAAVRGIGKREAARRLEAAG